MGRVMAARMPLYRGRRITSPMAACFAKMERLVAACMCPEPDWAGRYWERQPCAACDEWWEHHNWLHEALALPPWQWPAYTDPDAGSPYPIGSRAADSWQHQRADRPEQAELYLLQRRLLNEAGRPAEAAE